jgi:pimeloyl-ACP methyl ester carboxylesterase
MSILTRAAARCTPLVLAAFMLAALPPSSAGGDPKRLEGRGGAAQSPSTTGASVDIRTWTITYRAHDGSSRGATLVLPSWYGPTRNPPVPLVISPHGRGLSGRSNASLWGSLPALGTFAVVNPDGEGSRLNGRFSWGAPGQIDDLARMPDIVTAALPWLRIDRRHIYAVGGSMGGQETLLLLARYPRLLAGAVAVDPLVDFARQYRNFPRLGCDAECQRAWGGPLGMVLQGLARREVGGTPSSVPAAYAARSPISYARAIASSCVPLQLWWSRADRIVVDSSLQSGLLFARVRQLDPKEPLEEFVGSWRHTAVMHASALLPTMLAGLGLLSTSSVGLPAGVHVDPAPASAEACRE